MSQKFCMHRMLESHMYIVKVVKLVNYRMENRTSSTTLKFRQSGFGEDAWILLGPLSTTSFAWEDPFGQKLLDTEICTGANTTIWKVDLDKPEVCPADDGQSQVSFHVVETDGAKVAQSQEILYIYKNSTAF